MYSFRKVTEDIYWVGSNDRRLAMFEGVYSVPDGVSYNSYLIMDDKTVLMDTVDKAVDKVFFENIKKVMGGRSLDFIVVNHMEPDHSATLHDVLMRYPNATVVCSALTKRMIGQFFEEENFPNIKVVAEGDVLETGHHELMFVSAPMVHWPEVTVAYDKVQGILFSADAFGSFGALNGALFCDEVNFERDYLDESRRYYTNIVGKYGPQVTQLLDKAQSLDIKMICPLHGFVWRKNISYIIDKYRHWSSYTPEKDGVMIAYASVYGNTENAAEILATELRERGVKTVMYDVSVIPASNIVSAAFEYSHFVFASTTYNAGIFVRMEELLHDLVAHNISKRKVAFIENGSWAPTSGKLMKKLFENSNEIEIIEDMVSLRSSVKSTQREAIESLADTLAKSIKDNPVEAPKKKASAMFNLTYGLYALFAKEGGKDNGCIINTATQISDGKKKIFSIAVNKGNYTHDMITKTGEFNISVLSQDAEFSVYKRFGFSSGRDTDKFADCQAVSRSKNGLIYLGAEVSNSFISAKVINTVDCDTHTLFIAEVTESEVLSDTASATYEYYFDRVKPKQKAEEKKVKGYVCKICGYVYEGEELPEDFVCPLCKHPASDFEKII
ncbi:MAG: flavin reductase [Ruminococcus sp.]